MNKELILKHLGRFAIIGGLLVFWYGVGTVYVELMKVGTKGEIQLGSLVILGMILMNTLYWARND